MTLRQKGVDTLLLSCQAGRTHFCHQSHQGRSGSAKQAIIGHALPCPPSPPDPLLHIPPASATSRPIPAAIFLLRQCLRLPGDCYPNCHPPDQQRRSYGKSLTAPERSLIWIKSRSLNIYTVLGSERASLCLARRLLKYGLARPKRNTCLNSRIFCLCVRV